MANQLGMIFPRFAQLMIVLGRVPTERDALSDERLRRAERRLGIVLPQTVAGFYQYVGAAPELQEHDRLRHPEALDIEDGFLVFMEENQTVISWGLPLPLGEVPDPTVWQRVNSDPRAWYPEPMTFSEFIVTRLAFTRGVTMNDEQSRQHGS